MGTGKPHGKPKRHNEKQPHEKETHESSKESEEEVESIHATQHGIYEAANSKLIAGHEEMVRNFEEELKLANEHIEQLQVALKARARMDQLEVDAGANHPNPRVGSGNRTRTLALLGMSIFAIGELAGLIVLGYILAQSEEQTKDPEEEKSDDPYATLPQVFKDRIDALVKSWNELPDEAFWDSYIDYVKEKEPSLFRQRYIVWVLQAAATDVSGDRKLVAQLPQDLHLKWAETGEILDVYEVTKSANPVGRKVKLELLLAFLNNEFFPGTPEE